MKWKETFRRFSEKAKSIWDSSTNFKIIQTFNSLWKTGKLQKRASLTYDIVWNVILFFLIIGFIGFVFAGGIGLGYFASLVKDEPVRTYAEMEKDIYNYAETSKIYFDNEVYIGDIRSDLKREETTLDHISPLLIDAVIATEDEYFEEHKGIVPKAIFRALFQEVTNASTQSGGSTLTQQLIKNQILTNEVSFERKAKEMLLALRLERFFEKDEILEAYLNIVPYGRNSNGDNIAGIQTASQGIFGVNADELNLPQAAYLAGLPQSPSYYTPFKNSGGLKEQDGIEPGITRMKTVLDRMLDMGFIKEKEYKEALAYDITEDFIKPKKSPEEQYPYLTQELQIRAKAILAEKLLEEDGYTKEDLNKIDGLREQYDMLADRALQNNGYRIHSTINKDIYDVFQEVAKNYEYYGPNTTTELRDKDGNVVKTINQEVEASAILIENRTGRIISFLGGRDFTEEDQTNYITRVRSNGSTMKPFMYAAAMEKGVVQPGTPIADIPTTFPGGYTPSNFDRSFHGLLTVRDHLRLSYNIPAVKVYQKIADDNPVEQYIEKMGITSLRDNEYANLSLAIGGTTDGITIEENTNAFTTFGNDGKFVDGHMIDKITTKDGEVIYEYKAEPVDVFSPQTSYLMVDMMRDVISNGTASYINSQLKYPGVDWAGKSGTSQNVEDLHFVGLNPNVTLGVWLGYEYPDSLQCNSCSLYHSHRNFKLWAELVNKATDINPELMAPNERFQQPEGIVSRSFCATSGKLPTDLCSEAGLVRSDIFNSKYVPTEYDDSLMRGGQVVVDGKALMAGDDTPSEFVNGKGIVFNPDWLRAQGYDKLSNIQQLFPSYDRGKWERIAAPNRLIQSSVTNDGKAPSGPSSINYSGDKLKWNKSSSKDVIGYRIYYSSEPGEKFSIVGSTTSTNYSVGNSDGVYQVTAVDHFGLESKPSKQIIIGDVEEAASADKPTETDKKEKTDSGEKKNKKDKKNEPKDEGKKENKENNGGNEENNNES